MKEDEKKFLIDLYKASLDLVQTYAFGIDTGLQPRLHVRDIINQDGFYMHYKRAWYLLEKWCSKGWYEYGVTLDLGWLTDTGKMKAREVLNA